MYLAFDPNFQRGIQALRLTSNPWHFNLKYQRKTKGMKIGDEFNYTQLCGEYEQKSQDPGSRH